MSAPTAFSSISFGITHECRNKYITISAEDIKNIIEDHMVVYPLRKNLHEILCEQLNVDEKDESAAVELWYENSDAPSHICTMMLFPEFNEITFANVDAFRNIVTKHSVITMQLVWNKYGLFKVVVPRASAVYKAYAARGTRACGLESQSHLFNGVLWSNFLSDVKTLPHVAARDVAIKQMFSSEINAWEQAGGSLYAKLVRTCTYIQKDCLEERIKPIIEEDAELKLPPAEIPVLVIPIKFMNQFYFLYNKAAGVSPLYYPSHLNKHIVQNVVELSYFDFYVKPDGMRAFGTGEPFFSAAAAVGADATATRFAAPITATALIPEPDPQWPCPVCTFLNSSSATKCDMCEGKKPVTRAGGRKQPQKKRAATALRRRSLSSRKKQQRRQRSKSQQRRRRSKSRQSFKQRRHPTKY